MVFKSLFAASLIAAALFVLSPVMAQDDEGDEAVVRVSFSQGDELLDESFDSDDAWENYSDDRGVDFGVERGEYRMHMPSEMSASYVWGLNSTVHDNVIIEATFTQETDDTGSSFGLMCRTDAPDSGNGYYFLIDGEGYGYIGKASEGVDSVEPITDEVESRSIRTGAESNEVRAVCVDNYLALYVNGRLVVDANDDDFASGYAGLSASSGEEQDADILVDDLSIFEAVIESGGDTSALVLPELQNVTAGAVLDEYDFEDSDDWPSFNEDSGLDMGIEDGAYHVHVPASLSGEYIWTTGTAAKDVIINVRATLLDGPESSVYGVMCRVDDTEKGTGYFLSIAGDGYYTIERVSYRNGEFDVTELVEWAQSEAINQGYASNDITAVCAGNYLALYANGELLAEARDRRFTGDVYALEVGLSEEADLDVTFDDLTIYEAETN